MSHPGDNLVLALLIGVMFFLLLRNWVSFSFITDWLKKSSKREWVEPRGEIPHLLRQKGFEVVDAKVRVPLTIDVDDHIYESRLYIDYLAHSDQGLYIVIVSRERKPLRMTGPALRDHFLPYYLLYRPEGILYVDREKGKIKVIEFDVPNMRFRTKQGFKWSYIAAVAFGMILALLIR
ncbi:hypothetical protein ACFO25_02015 [Paenactinomyces guangxiensis]|uniref:Uncharacterized protein n=1 Tax=Paenactinomyces guangxiensis TaxID=1490290 RepID=A0A7W2A8V3_9BACL|nr:hypothetical protein [Paenactinomyces guangxiensis]MBA4495005.1 hypothetical protein [Paenactinomyces guangxiensis]MBH8592088.1 hypothetical protein [Paenactinomyces guangxiensis]